MKTNNFQFFIFTLSTSSLGRSSSCSALVWCETGAIVSIVRWVAGFIGELNNREYSLRNPGSKIWRHEQGENEKMNHDCCFWCQDRAWLNDDLVTDSGTRNLIITESLDHKREIVEVFASEEHPCMQNIHKNHPLAASYWTWATKSVRIFICTIKRVCEYFLPQASPRNSDCFSVQLSSAWNASQWRYSAFLVKIDFLQYLTNWIFIIFRFGGKISIINTYQLPSKRIFF